ncbi:hypothetical protein MTO96_038875 [Rhipicephalus appendiculatus]
MATAPTGQITLHDRLASAVGYLGGYSVGANIETSGIEYTCVMATDPGRQTAVQHMICFRFHPSLPHFYVQPAFPSSRFITALHQLLRGDPARMPEDYIGELRLAFTGVHEPFGAVAAPRTSNPWDHPGITSMIPFQTGRREERRQPARASSAFFRRNGTLVAPGSRRRNFIRGDKSIQSALISLNPLNTRVFCLAWFYCCLAERCRLSPWVWFHVEATATAPTGHLNLHDRLASAVRNPGGYSVGANIETSGIKYTCVMATDPGRQTAVQHMICFRFHPSLPHFPVHPALRNSRFIAALHQLLRGDPARMPEDCLGELRFTFTGVPEPFGAVAAPRNSDPWDHPGITSLIPFQTDRREERR